MFDVAPWMAMAGKIGIVGICLFFIAYLIHNNQHLQRRLENMESRQEVATSRTVDALHKLTEVLSVFKAEVLARLK